MPLIRRRNSYQHVSELNSDSIMAMVYRECGLSICDNAIRPGKISVPTNAWMTERNGELSTDWRLVNQIADGIHCHLQFAKTVSGYWIHIEKIQTRVTKIKYSYEEEESRFSLGTDTVSGKSLGQGTAPFSSGVQLIEDYLESEDNLWMNWPTRSLDLYSIENGWAVLSRATASNPPYSKKRTGTKKYIAGGVRSNTT
ncbi:hypothetical protein TNCV_4054801 [Trichonephila clavipes]|nr:hypothetical protein TNCV_4054801 [Trichonephila clavipes]